MTAMTRLDLPYVQAHGDGGVRSQTQIIVIHATDNTASAEDEAAYASHREDKTSAHVYVDGDSAVQALDLDHIAYGCYPTGNGRSIQVELCGHSDHLDAAVIARAAVLVATVATSWGIPAAHLTPDQMRAGTKGIAGHGDVTAAWHEGDHTDPGPHFPWDPFIAQVQAAAGGAPIPPAPWLRRSWPSYMKSGNFFGLYTGPAASHGGYYASERPDVKAIQQRVIVLGYVPGIADPASSWADGIFGPNTKAAVTRWQSARYAATTTRHGEVWSDDWAHLFTY